MTFGLFTNIALVGSLEHIYIYVPSIRGEVLTEPATSGSSHFPSGGTCFLTGASSKKRARGRREGRMFILDSHEMKSAMFAKSTKANSNIELWHRRIGHINLNKLKAMNSKGVVIGLPTFKEKVIEGMCEACQFGKQHRHPFPKE